MESDQAFEAEDWQDALYPWDLIRMNERLLCGMTPEKNGTISKSAIIQGAVSIGKKVTIGPYTVITGPGLIGKDTEYRGPLRVSCLTPASVQGETLNPSLYR